MPTKKSKWKDRTKKNGGDEVAGSEINFGCFKIWIHRHINHPKTTWLASERFLFYTS